ncbi:hypothetical protein [Mycobacterium sp. 1274756.6]|uniref:hypothetical protein n=1 Tax=Mycobacterium sp. 1274756.6 TaxID=1834076 RepID=UPI0012E817B6|nr:hypothetical protein [Mycobacterium sp. 1274756.6]
MRPPSSSASWRLDALGEQLSRSHAELKSTTARYGEVAGRIPSDINDMKDRLSTILRAATEEAEAIVADARQTATKLREDATALAEETARAHRSAEKDRDEAAKLAAEAKREHQSVTEMRATLEAKTKQFEAETTRTRDEVARESAELMRNAEARAEKTLKDVQRDIDSHIAEAEAKLAELNRIREDIVTQIRAFYDRFSMLEFAGGGSGGAGTVSPVVNVASFARSQRRGDAKSARPAAPSHPPGGDRRLPGGA